MGFLSENEPSFREKGLKITVYANKIAPNEFGIPFAMYNYSDSKIVERSLENGKESKKICEQEIQESGS